MSESEASHPVAGKHFPWHQIAGYYLRLDRFSPFAKVEGDHVGPALMGAYGMADVELPNPDVQESQRLLTLPIEHKSDLKSLVRAHLDTGVQNKTNELVVVYEHRRGLFGGKQPCLHVAAYPFGTWSKFFEAVARYAAKEFQWPPPLFLFQPSGTPVFPGASNLFSP